jgi:hypothetical protein
VRKQRNKQSSFGHAKASEAARSNRTRKDDRDRLVVEIAAYGKAPSAKSELIVTDNGSQVGAQAGSNKGGKFVDAKAAQSGAFARNEWLAAQRYQAAGVVVPQLRSRDTRRQDCDRLENHCRPASSPAGDASQRRSLADTLIARRADLIARASSRRTEKRRWRRRITA